MTSFSYADVQEAARRIAGRVRRAPALMVDGQLASFAGCDEAELYLGLEFLQHTGTFKARGAQNFIQAHREAGTLPEAGITIASGGNAGLACAWAARDQGLPATVFLPEAAPAVKVSRLRGYGADIRLVGSEYAEALEACQAFSEETGALASHAYDNPLVAAGAGTLLDELRNAVPHLDTVVVAVGGGGLFAGVAAAAHHRGIRTIAVEPQHCSALHAALAAGEPVDVAVDSIAADSLGARRVSSDALSAAHHELSESVLVSDELIVRARQALWDDYRLAVEHGAGTALAGLLSPEGYQPAKGETVCVVLCGANTNPADLAK